MSVAVALTALVLVPTPVLLPERPVAGVVAVLFAVGAEVVHP